MAKSVFSLTVLAVALVLGATALQFAQKSSVSTASLPELFGAHKMGHGFNALTGQSGDFPVVQFTYEGGQTWTSPKGITYKVPDQTYLSPQTQSHTMTCTSISTKFSDVFNAYSSGFSFSVGIDVGAFGLAANYNRQLSKTKQEVASNDKYYGMSNYYTNYYSLDMSPAYMLQMDFQMKQALMFLPPNVTNDASNKMYEEFVTSFGTHYVTLADFGGQVHTMSFLNKSFSHSHSTSDISTQMGLSFHYELYKLTLGHNSNRSSIHIAKWFKENAHTYNFWTGGNQTLQHNTTQQQWLDSVADAPGMVNRTLMPLDRLITNDNSKQACLAAYVKEYIKSQGKTKGWTYP